MYGSKIHCWDINTCNLCQRAKWDLALLINWKPCREKNWKSCKRTWLKYLRFWDYYWNCNSLHGVVLINRVHSNINRNMTQPIQLNYIWPGETELTGLEEWSTALLLNKLPSTCRGTCCPWMFYRVWKHKRGCYNVKIFDEHMAGAETYSHTMISDTNIRTSVF